MTRRSLLVALLILGSAGSGAVAADSGRPPLIAGGTIYVVQPDPRLCPSPLCGGYWVSRANDARTRCHDAVFRARCYVATAVAQRTGRPLARAIPAGSLVRAGLGASEDTGFGELGVLILAESWRPATQASASGDYYRLRDLGVRCIRAPCFSIRAWRVNGAFRATVSDLDLRPSAADPETQRKAVAALASPAGLLVRGRLVAGDDGGRVLRATRVFLREPPPRA